MDEHNRRIINRFDAWSSTYGADRIASWFSYYQAYALNSFNILENANFLDVGCGTGWAVTEIAKKLKFGKACGMDISSQMIKKARADAGKIPNIDFCIANAEYIPYQDESFNFVLSTFSLHHYLNPLQALCEIKRVMKKGGELIIIDSARDVSLPIYIQDCWRRFFEKSHIKYYKINEMKVLIEQAQLKLVGKITTDKKFLFKGKVFTGLMIVKCVK
jgi:ubiquinone/menaquinone biosynthesis C-methylase UbiE